MHALVHIGVVAITVLLLARYLPGIKIKSQAHAVLVAVVFSLLNFGLGWLIKAVLFVPALLTLGLLFLFIPFIVNTIVLWLTDKLLGSFEIDELGTLLKASGAITLASWVTAAVLHHLH